MAEVDFTKERLSLSKAVRLKCLDCCGFSKGEVNKCKIKECSLYPYKMGKADTSIKKTTKKVDYFVQELKSMGGWTDELDNNTEY